MPNFNDNTTGLQQILETVNALPDAGSGGGGVETCTVTLTSDAASSTLLVDSFYYTTSGCVKLSSIEPLFGGATSCEVICPSSIVLHGTNFTVVPTVSSGSATISKISTSGYGESFGIIAYHITGDCTLDWRTLGGGGSAD